MNMSQLLRFSCAFILVLSFGLIHEANAQMKPPSIPVVRGQLVTKNKLPVVGATVLVEGTTKGTVSDANRFFELDLSLITEKKVTLVLGHFEHANKSVEVELKDLPMSFGQIKMSDGAFEE